MKLEEAIIAHRTASDFNFDGASCYGITPRLLRGWGLSESQSEVVNALDAGFADAAPSAHEFEVYRGAHQSSIDLIRQHSEGRFPAFMATSYKIAEALRFLPQHESGAVLLRITCPPGTKSIDVSQAGIATLEQGEVLLPRGMQFTVADWEPRFTLSEEKHLLLEMCPASAYYHLTAIPEASQRMLGK